MRRLKYSIILLMPLLLIGWQEGGSCDAAGPIAERWVSEARVDTIDRLMFDEFPGKGLTFDAPNKGASGNYFLRLNTNDWFAYDYSHIDADSAILDSVLFHYYVILTDADTLLFGYYERSGWDNLAITSTLTDTVEHAVSATWHETVISYGFSIPERDRQRFPLIAVEDCSNAFCLVDLILYYHAYHRRYGIPD